MRGRPFLNLLAGLACGAAVCAAALGGAFEALELRALDTRFRLLARPERASRDIVLAAIDDKSLAYFEQNGIVWKWPRDLYAALVRYLARGGARVVCFDILFADPDVDRVNADAEETDGALAASLEQAGNVLLASYLGAAPDPALQDNPLEYRPPFDVVPKEALERYATAGGAVLPIALFQRAAAAVGAANYEADPEDGVCRRLPLLFAYRGLPFPHLGLAAYMLYKGGRTLEILPTGRMRVGELEIPVDGRGRFLVSWYGRGGPGGCFRTYSIASLILSAVAEETGKPPLVPSSAFRGKIVIVGASATGLMDFRATPFTGLEPYPAMEIYATVASNLLGRHFLRRAPAAAAAAAVLALSVVPALAFFRWKRIPWILTATAAAALGWTAAALALFRFGDLWVDWVAPEAGLVAFFSACALASYATEGRERRRLKSLFSRYVSPQVVSEILEQEDRLEFGGREVVATVFFSDIREFTSICEETEPRAVVSLLNRYFAAVTDEILRRGGSWTSTSETA